MTIHLSTASLTGGRTENEDTLTVYHDKGRNRTTAVVCDGLGGHVAGKAASSTAAKAFVDHCRSHADTAPEARLRGALDAANDAVRDAIIKNPRLHGMGTTLLAVETGDDTEAHAGDDGSENAGESEAHWISVGDSPLWSCQSGDLCALVNMMHNTPGLRNRLTSAVMGDEIPDIDQGSIEFEPGDTLIAASDGLDTLKNGRLLHLARTTHILKLAGALADEAVAAGGPQADNTSVVAIHRPPAK